MWARHRHEHIADVLRYSCAFYSSCFQLYGFFFKTILSNVNVIAPFWIIFVQNGGLRVNLSIWFLVLFFTVRMRDKRHFWNLPVRSSIWTVHVLSLVPFFSLTDNYWASGLVSWYNLILRLLEPFRHLLKAIITFHRKVNSQIKDFAADKKISTSNKVPCEILFDMDCPSWNKEKFRPLTVLQSSWKPGLILILLTPWVTKTEFLLTKAIQYRADKWWE